MGMYIVILLIPLTWFVVLKSKKRQTLKMLSCFISLFLISAFRDRKIGADYNTYVNYYYSIARTHYAHFEKGFVVLNEFINNGNSPYYMLAIAVNVMLFVPLFFFIAKNIESKYWSFCVLVFVSNPYMYIQSSFNVLRQCCAMGIVIIAVHLFAQKSFWRYVLAIILFVLAMLFHKSAILALICLIPFLLDIKWDAKIWKIVALIGLFISTLGYEIVIRILHRTVYVKYVAFERSILDNDYYIALIFIFIWWLCCNYNKFAYGKHVFFINLYMFTTCMLPMVLKNDMLYRFRVYFLFMSLPGIAAIFENLDNNIQNNKINKCVSIGKMNITINKLVFFLFVSYHIFFYITYIAYLAYTKNTNYVPFKFGDFR